MKHRKLSIGQQMTILLLILVLPASALMIAWYQSSNQTKQAVMQSQYYWQDKQNTRVSLEDIQNMANSLDNQRASIVDEDEYAAQIFSSVGNKVNSIDSKVYEYVNDDTAVDFYNFQTELYLEQVQEYESTLREYFAQDAEALQFLQHFVFEDVHDFEMKTTSNARAAVFVVPGLSGVSQAILTGAFKAAELIVKVAKWFVPLFITVGLVVAALAVIGTVIYLNWDVIRPVFSNLVNSFVNGLGKVAGAVRDFFNGLLNQALVAFTKTILGVKYIIDVALTTANISQIQRSSQYFLMLLNNGKMYFFPIAVSQNIAMNVLIMNNEFLGTYTLNQWDAVDVAQKASPTHQLAQYGNPSTPFQVHGKTNGNSIYFWHCHPLRSGPNNGSKAHSWYGYPYYG